MSSDPALTPAPTPNPAPASTQSISIKSAARKLPIKRKSPDLPSPNPNLSPNSEPDQDSTPDNKPPPFKFHRIWNEPDEIRFLQGLLDSSSHGLIFPRDLHIFYDRFSNAITQPYTRSQLSEKLRRLRRKFRLISGRIDNGLDPSRLSHHDKALFDLSKRLWDPNFADDSPFNVNRRTPESVSVEVSFNPTFTPAMASKAVVLYNESEKEDVKGVFGTPSTNTSESDSVPVVPVPVPVTTDDVKANYVHGVECKVEATDRSENAEDSGIRNGGLTVDRARGVVGKIVMDVFDKTLEEVRTNLMDSDKEKSCFSASAESSRQVRAEELMKRCREQRIAELDVLARRVRLMLEDSIHHQ